MNITFCLDSNLINQACIMLTSVQANNKIRTIHFYAFLLNPKKEDVLLLQNAVVQQNTLEVFEISDSDLQDLTISSAYISKATYLRFFIEPKLGNKINKVLYLDCDLLVCGNIFEFYDMDISDYSVAACYDLEVSDICRYNRLGYDISENYFNAGVLLINLDYWKKNNISQKCLQYLISSRNKCVLFDQDALNHFLHGTVRFVSSKYNVLCDFFNTKLDTFLISDWHKSKILIDIQDPVIIHYAGKYKPWYYDYHKYGFPFGKTWKKYLQLSNLNYKIRKEKDKNSFFLKTIIKRFLIKIGIKKVKYPTFINTDEIEMKLL